MEKTILLKEFQIEMAIESEQQVNSVEIPMLEALPRDVVQMHQVWSEDPNFILYPTPRSVLLPPSPPSKLLIILYALSIGFVLAYECYDYLETESGWDQVYIIFYYPLLVFILLVALIAPIIKSDKLLFIGIIVQSNFLPNYIGEFIEILLFVLFDEYDMNTYIYISITMLLIQMISMIVFLVTSANLAYIYRSMREFQRKMKY